MILKGKLLYILLLFLLLPPAIYAQPLPEYPKGYFIWPLDLTPEIVANFGELRVNHYHMGLDCRTAQKQNLPVYAVADGYISRIKIEPLGFGRAIYIDHPNGYTSLYAHLNDFFPELEQYVKEQQYKLKSWAVDLHFTPGQFPVEKCKFIAYSGNTGASQGPHVHFEIRDSKTEKVLNPTLFGLPLPDTIAPDIMRLAIYDREQSSYEQSPRIFSLVRKDSFYTTVPPIIKVDARELSFGISASDRCNGSSNRNGIFSATLYENNQPVSGFRMNNIGYDETRYLNAHIDYKLRSGGGPMIQHITRLPGYPDGIYSAFSNNGLISITDTLVHFLRITVSDADGNSSDLLFGIQSDSSAGNPTAAKTGTDQRPLFSPGNINVFENDNIRFYLPANCLYDSFRFSYSESKPKTGYPVYQLHNASIPLHSYFPVTIRGASSMPGKTVIHRFANGRHDYSKAEPVQNGKESGWYKAWFRDLGSFQLMVDSIPPVITPIGFKEKMNAAKLKQLVFVVTDNTEDIKQFTATLDGNWLRFSNDKGRRFVYEFDERCGPGEHELKIVAEDQVGNVNTKIYHFTR
ncbi:MAG: M23 family metallopeptidase [Ferruginibacter sp.]|nr:M23 family metallopeptidase [Ferruginibacter sp.]